MITRRRFLQWPIFLPFLGGPVAPPTTQQWEYLIVVCDPSQRGALPEVLGKRGLEGWELCTRTDRSVNLVELVFKRPV